MVPTVRQLIAMSRHVALWCWSHVRREYVEAEKVAPVSSQVLSLLGSCMRLRPTCPTSRAAPLQHQHLGLGRAPRAARVGVDPHPCPFRSAVPSSPQP
jgi:hypothetical protein